MTSSAFRFVAWLPVLCTALPWATMAQDQTAPAAPEPAAASAQAAAPAQTTSASTTSNPAPNPGNDWFSGWFEVGYRWGSGVGGSLETYRSFVNLGSGPKLLGTEFSITDPKHRLFDQIDVRAYNWGDEPSETLHADVKKKKWYELNADYRDFAYFDNLPSFADPLLSQGVFLDEQAFDTRRHLGSYSLDLLPGNWIVPYLAFERDADSGIGTDTFVSFPNEFPMPFTNADRTNLYRGGVRIEKRHFHVTLEQGGTTFSSSENQYQSPSSPVNYGNNPVPFFGQNIDLQSLADAYGITGSSVYTKGLITVNAGRYLDLYGQYLFSEPQTNVNYTQDANGNFVVENQLLFYTSQGYLLSSAARLPHNSASFGAEARPFKGVRLIENWLTDRLHEAGSANSGNALGIPTGSPALASSVLTQEILAASLASNYNQNEANILYDPWAKLSLRVGYRYVWGRAMDDVLPAADLVSADMAKMRSNVGLVGFTYRPLQKFTLSGSGEFAASGGEYFRTSLYNYQKLTGKARYQATKTLTLSADFLLLNNHDPQPGVDYEFSSHQESLTLLWTPPKQGWDFEGSYTRATIYSNIGYIEPETFGPQLSLYRDNAHNASTLFHIKLGKSKGPAPQLAAGGSLFISSGSRPTAYYQPQARLTVPWGKRTNLFAQWTYYGYGEAFYLYEGFRTHLVTVGLRFTPWGG
jgi:hypothetical protein